MKEKETSKICQAFDRIQKAMGLKGRAKYTKILRGIVGTCLTIWLACLTLGLLYSAFEDRVDAFVARNITGRGFHDDKELSPNVYFQQSWYDNFGRVFNHETGKATLKKVDWVTVAADGDSLAVFCRNGKRGYINRFTGEVVIPAQFNKAWIFSEGLAAVQYGEQLMFIGHDGRTMLNAGWKASYGHDPVFKDGYCVVWSGGDNGFGVIDKTGAWHIEPAYDNITREKGLWIVEIDKRFGILDADLNEILPTIYEDTTFEDDFIRVQPYLKPAMAYSYDGKLINECIYNYVNSIYYESGMDEDFNEIYSPASCYRYSVTISSEYDVRYGLLDKSGKTVTEPVFESISAVGYDLYFCDPQGIIINGKGEVVE